MVTILSAVSGDTEGQHLNRPEGFDLQPGESGFVMARAKLSYAPPQPNIWIRRRGFAFEYFTEQPRNSDAVRDAEKVAEFLADELSHGRRYTNNILESCGKLPLSRQRVRTALARLRADNRVEDRELPTEERRGGKKTYLYARKASPNLATPPGEVGTQNGEFTNPQEATSPAATTSPPYREYKSGEVAAALYPHASLISPADNGEVVAKWRSGETEGHQSPCGLTAPQQEDVSRDAETLTGVLKFYRGWVPPKELSHKCGYWPESRVIAAAEWLVKHRRAVKEGGMYKPVVP